MPYLIDGHNLVPKVPGLSLKAVDDEEQLIQLLQEFCRISQKQAEVYFDNAPPGQPARQSYGRVTAYFVRQGQTADSAIRARLARLGKNAANLTVVSTDGAVQSAARLSRAKVLSSDQFVRLLAKTSQAPMSEAEGSVGPEEVQHWLDLFNQGKDY